ncbi:MAG: MTAP family purine nucleoside phosphorylase [Methanothrix sp.]|uniref:MTAP family purine nucleoside phosphorylase n=1 Tax=Methanothrix sp. TaxID=90426 RepID=UPI0025E0D0FB|nr:MTAP family purine nucleoside phosphorylase [Methanothrix sp.]MCQ8903934.1 MTAP family purine nucleoside phosphorylase [Methanothrix sp.]
MRADIAIIGRILTHGGERVEVSTPYGNVRAISSRISGRDVIVIPRHGDSHLPPHRVNYRAIICAAASAGAVRIIAINTVGSMISPPGSFVIPKDFIEFTKSRVSTFYEDRAVHVDMSEPYCPEIRTALIESCRAEGHEPYEGVYVCTEGPHLETHAQIRMLRSFGDVVGMTGYPEVVLAKERALCYASICLVTNTAGDGQVDLSQIMSVESKARGDLARIIEGTVSRIPGRRSCRCCRALENAEL